MIECLLGSGFSPKLKKYKLHMYPRLNVPPMLMHSILIKYSGPQAKKRKEKKSQYERLAQKMKGFSERRG